MDKKIETRTIGLGIEALLFIDIRRGQRKLKVNLIS
jgi:hypothetical protein